MNLMLIEEWTTSPSQADGLTEAEERRQLSELYAYVNEMTKLVKRDQYIASSSMVLIHKFFKTHSLTSVKSSQLLIAASCVFLSAKVLYVPVTLEKVVQALFNIEKRLNKELQHASMSKDREVYYRSLIEDQEFKVLEAVSFDTELELPYSSIRGFCERHASAVSKDSLFSVAFKFCNDSFKLPLCLYFHPKVIAAACIQMAALWRKKQGLDPGIQSTILGHPWFKWIDSGIESDQVSKVIEYVRSLFNQPTQPQNPPAKQISSSVQILFQLQSASLLQGP